MIRHCEVFEKNRGNLLVFSFNHEIASLALARSQWRCISSLRMERSGMKQSVSF